MIYSDLIRINLSETGLRSVWFALEVRALDYSMLFRVRGVGSYSYSEVVLKHGRGAE